MNLADIAAALRADAGALRFGPPVSYVYNPLEYAWTPHHAYLERYGTAPKEVLLVGMNPGPWGMAQTGVPFGDVALVRDWLNIRGPVGQPADGHAKRPVLGFACRRGEGSGRRLWGWAKQRFVTPDAFFQRFFVVNYCPLLFYLADGTNLTPDKLPVADRRQLFAVCDQALARTVDCLKPRYVLGVGRFAEQRAKAAVRDGGITVAGVPHPSPASPLANRGWAEAMEAALRQAGVF